MEAACLYQETRLSIEPAHGDAVIDILLPRNDAATSFASRSSPKRRKIDRDVGDEDSFSRKHLATQGSVYFCQSINNKTKEVRPRSIVWRVLEDQKVLELQAIDLVQEAATREEPLLTLRFQFPSAIRKNTVCFAEPTDATSKWSLSVFVLTDTAEIHTLTLPRESFIKAESLRLDRHTDWHAYHSPNAFIYRTPFRLIAQSEGIVWASLSDGALVKLEKYHGQSQWSWRETFFTEAGWTASLKGLMPWKATNAVQFEDTVLQSSAAISLAISPDKRHVWTVCLDHTVRAWNTSTGKVVQHFDLAGNTQRDLSKPYTALLDPTNMQLLQVQLSASGDSYRLVTFSPKMQTFKFWLVRDADVQQFGVEDIRPDAQLSPPLENLVGSTVWTLESFQLGQAYSQQVESLDLWLLVRSGMTAQAFRLTFKLDDHIDELTKSFAGHWVKMTAASTTTEELKKNLTNPVDGDAALSNVVPMGITEQWTYFLFYPGRFSTATLETALMIYNRSLGRSAQLSETRITSTKLSLAERVCEVVGRTTTLKPTNSSQGYGRYEYEVGQQWHIFYGVVKSLHQRREKPLSLAFDSESGIPWLLLSDHISLLRPCAAIEILWHNRSAFANSEPLHPVLSSLDVDKNLQIGQLLCAVDAFRKTFSPLFVRVFISALNNDPGEGDSETRILEIYQRSGFAGQVTDDDYNILTNALDTMAGFSSLTLDLFNGALDALDEPQRGGNQTKQLARYGARVLVSGSRDTIQLTSEIILEMLLLVVFMAAELEEADLPESFDHQAIFGRLMEAWKNQQVLEWLARKTRPSAAASQMPASDSQSLALGPTESDIVPSSSTSLHEGLFIGDWSKLLSPVEALGDVVTYWCRSWTFGLRLQDQYSLITCNIMADLIRNKEVGLANDFLRFLPENPWATYLQARLALQRGDFEEAARLFKLTANKFASMKSFDVDRFNAAALLTPLEHDLFGDGQTSYYRHIEQLFAATHVMSHAADFAQLALHSLRSGAKMDQVVRSDLLSRLFTSTLSTQRFEIAFSTLLQYTDMNLQRSALHSLLAALLANSRTTTLLSLNFPTALAEEADAYLVAQTAKFPAPAALEADGAVSHHKVLYAWRIGRGDYRGAASCLWERLQAVRQHPEADDDEVAELFLALLNVLSLVDAEQAWILTRPLPPAKTLPTSVGALGRLGQEGEAERPKRRVVTLDDVRAMWQQELDRVADVEAGRFPMPLSHGGVAGRGADDVMEVDVFA